MKILRYISFVAAALAMFSCQEVDQTCALPADKVAVPVLDEHSDIVVDADNLSSDVTFTWSAVDYGYPAAVSYALYAVYGDAEPYQIGESHSTSYTLTKETLNNALVNSKGLAVPAEATSTVFFYIVASISTGSDDSYVKKSEPIALQITTIKSTSAPWIRRPLYVPGAHQGWSPATAPVLWETGENSDIYEGLVYLVPADAAAVDCEFKFTDQPDWNAGANLGTNLDALENGGGSGNLKTAKGLYWIKVTLESDHSTGSVKLTPVTQVGVTGAAIDGWPDDINTNPDLVMKLAGLPEDYTAEGAEALHNNAVNAQIWEGVCDDCKGGEFKFRLNADWGLNWGGDNLEHINFNGSNCKTDLTGTVRFTINFRGDIAALAEDATNPSPISATVEKVE